MFANNILNFYYNSKSKFQALVVQKNSNSTYF